MVKSPARRAVVDYLRSTYQLSQRRACSLILWLRESYRYKSKLNPANEMMRARLREIGKVRVRYGWRRMLVLMRREGYAIGETRLRRLYALEGLNLRVKTPKRRRSAAVRQARVEATAPNQVWSMDFMHDRLSDGSEYRLLNIVDVFIRRMRRLAT
jgi:putative transposase